MPFLVPWLVSSTLTTSLPWANTTLARTVVLGGVLAAWSNSEVMLVPPPAESRE